MADRPTAMSAKPRMAPESANRWRCRYRLRSARIATNRMAISTVAINAVDSQIIGVLPQPCSHGALTVASAAAPNRLAFPGDGVTPRFPHVYDAKVPNAAARYPTTEVLSPDTSPESA